MTYDYEIEQRQNGDKAMIIVPMRLLSKIDRNREKMGRADFIELCIDTLLEMGEGNRGASRPAAVSSFTAPAPAPSSPAPRRSDESITRSELEEFKKGVKDLLKAYLDCFPDAAVEPLTQATREANERSWQLSDLLGR